MCQPLSHVIELLELRVLCSAAKPTSPAIVDVATNESRSPLHVDGAHHGLEDVPYKLNVGWNGRANAKPTEYVIDWGDDTVEPHTHGGSFLHTYNDSGDWPITVTAISPDGTFSTTHIDSAIPDELNMKAAATKLGEVRLNWSANAAKYAIRQDLQRSDDGFDFRTIARLSAGTHSYNVKGLAEGTHCYFQVVAVLRNGLISSPSYPADVTTLLLPPTNLRAKVVGFDEIDLSWKNNSTQTAYTLIKVSLVGVKSLEPIDSSFDNASYAVTGLDSDQHYFFSVYSVSSSGAYSLDSNIVGVKAPVAPPVDVTAKYHRARHAHPLGRALQYVSFLLR